MISGWIAQGMPAPEESDARVTAIQVSAARGFASSWRRTAIDCDALFSDGRTPRM